MIEHEVTCVNRITIVDPNQSIVQLGGRVGSTHWSKTRYEVALLIGTGTRFFVQGPGGHEYLELYNGQYVQTCVGGVWGNALNQLPECD